MCEGPASERSQCPPPRLHSTRFHDEVSGPPSPQRHPIRKHTHLSLNLALAARGGRPRGSREVAKTWSSSGASAPSKHKSPRSPRQQWSPQRPAAVARWVRQDSEGAVLGGRPESPIPPCSASIAQRIGNRAPRSAGDPHPGGASALEPRPAPSPPARPPLQDVPVCWICLDNQGPLIFPCRCPRCAAAGACATPPPNGPRTHVGPCTQPCSRCPAPRLPLPRRSAHPRCLARWQLQSAGSRCAPAPAAIDSICPPPGAQTRRRAGRPPPRRPDHAAGDPN